MRLSSRIAAVVAVAAMGIGVAASSAAALDLTGGAYTGTGTGTHSFTFDSAYTLTCDATFTGNTENGPNSATTIATPEYDNCDFFGFPADITIHGPFYIDFTARTGSLYDIDITLPPGSSVTIHVPLIGCTVTITDSQSFVNGSGGNSITGTQAGSAFELQASLAGIDYTTNGLCPFGSGSGGTYDTNGDVTFPGVSVDD